MQKIIVYVKCVEEYAYQMEDIKAISEVINNLEHKLGIIMDLQNKYAVDVEGFAVP